MADNTVTSIGQTESELQAVAANVLKQDKLNKSTEASPAAGSQKIKHAKTEPVKKDENPEIRRGLAGRNDTFLKFVVEKKNDEITVYVVDRETNRIKHSIHPNDVNNLKAGDLFKLLA